MRAIHQISDWIWDHRIVFNSTVEFRAISETYTCDADMPGNGSVEGGGYDHRRSSMWDVERKHMRNVDEGSDGV